MTDTSERNSSSRRVTRRTLLKGGALTIGCGIGAGLGISEFWSESARAAATGLSASDVSVTSNDGTISELTITPDLTVTWQGFDTPVNSLSVVIRAKTEHDSTPQPRNIKSHRIDLNSPTPTGTVEPNIGEVDMLSANPDVVDPADFTDDPGNGPSNTEVTVTVFVRLRDANNTLLRPIPSDEVTFTVSVMNRDDTATVSGTLNTNGS